MKRIFLGLAGGLIAAACTSEARETDTSSDAVKLPDSYAEGWTIQQFWSGEYPNGFAIEAADVAVMGRRMMDPEAPQDVTCPLPQFANYQPWNGERGQRDQVVYRTAVPRFEITATEDIELIAYPAFEEFAGPMTLSVEEGETITWVTYLAEGFFRAEYDGRTYDFEGAGGPEALAYPDNIPEDHQWVELTCDDDAGTRAWLRYSEVVEEDGISASPITGFGEASDLEPETEAD